MTLGSKFSSLRRWLFHLVALSTVIFFSAAVYAGDPVIKKSEYGDGDHKIEFKVVKAGRRASVTVSSVESSELLGTFRANKEGKLERTIYLGASQLVPCHIQVETSGGTAVRSVEHAPSDCGLDTDQGGNDGDVAAGHEGLIYTGPGTCLECHNDHALDVFESTHYQWKGIAPDMINQNGELQGKHAGAVNTYCGNITGNWQGCSSCHVGRGEEPEDNPTVSQLENIDCLVCHQDAYKRKKVNGLMQPDMAVMAISMDEAVQTVHKPTRAACLQCHAKAGGGDAVKRGDLALATAHTSDKNYDVHMATTGADLQCQACHVPENHRFPGKGSDIRPTDLDVDLDCASSSCHSPAPHDSSEINRHTKKVACQTCHIPVYAKNASDTLASEATEIHRSWQSGSEHETAPLHPVNIKANDLIPAYRHWNRASDNYLLFDEVYADWYTGTYPTSMPDGDVADPNSKLFPFKYKTSDYPIRSESNQLIALDTSVFFATADADAATLSGLENMGFDPSDDYAWVTTDTYQLLNHQVSPADDALNCTTCHMNASRMDLQGELGFGLSDANRNTCASGCHDSSKSFEWSFGDFKEFREHHKKHREKRAGCQECHSFSR